MACGSSAHDGHACDVRVQQRCKIPDVVSVACVAQQRRWWEDPSTHPTFPCDMERGTCDPNGFSVGDVFFAEVVVAYAVCANGGAIFELAAGEFFECDLDVGAFGELVQKIGAW